MDSEIAHDVPCSSIAVESVIRIGTAGLIWGGCAGPYDAKRKGLVGIARASFVTKSIGKFGFQCGLFAGVFSFTRCGIQRYRRQNDAVCSICTGSEYRNYGFICCHFLVNALVAGAVAGAAIGAGSRNWKQVAVMASVISTFCAVADYSKPV